jgi:hypothetical protein
MSASTGGIGEGGLAAVAAGTKTGVVAIKAFVLARAASVLGTEVGALTLGGTATVGSLAVQAAKGGALIGGGYGLANTAVDAILNWVQPTEQEAAQTDQILDAADQMQSVMEANNPAYTPAAAMPGRRMRRSGYQPGTGPTTSPGATGARPSSQGSSLDPSLDLADQRGSLDEEMFALNEDDPLLRVPYNWGGDYGQRPWDPGSFEEWDPAGRPGYRASDVQRTLANLSVGKLAQLQDLSTGTSLNTRSTPDNSPSRRWKPSRPELTSCLVVDRRDGPSR